MYQRFAMPTVLAVHRIAVATAGALIAQVPRPSYAQPIIWSATMKNSADMVTMTSTVTVVIHSLLASRPRDLGDLLPHLLNELQRIVTRHHTSACRGLAPCFLAIRVAVRMPRSALPAAGRNRIGRGGGSRTPSLRFWRPTLCQLSYTPLPSSQVRDRSRYSIRKGLSHFFLDKARWAPGGGLRSGFLLSTQVIRLVFEEGESVGAQSARTGFTPQRPPCRRRAPR